MPFVKWTVEPVFLSRQPIPPDKNVTDELEASANTTLVGTLRQLACLVSVADCIFEGISAECKLIQQRSESLRDKIERCERTVTELNAKAVRIHSKHIGKKTPCSSPMAQKSPKQDTYWFAHAGGDAPNEDGTERRLSPDRTLGNHDCEAGDAACQQQMSREERLRLVKERQEEERARRLQELEQHSQASQQYREQQEVERRRRIEELRSRDQERRQQVEERKRLIWEAEHERKEALLKRNMERESKLEARRNANRMSMSFAFGSSTPRTFDLDLATMGSAGAPVLMSAAPPRKADETDFESSRKRAASAYNLCQAAGDDPMTRSMTALPSQHGRGRRKTDLMPVIPWNRGTSATSRSRSPTAGAAAPPAAGSKEQQQSPSRPRSSLSVASEHSMASSQMSSSVVLRPRAPPRKPRPLSIAGTIPDKALQSRQSRPPDRPAPASSEKNVRARPGGTDQMLPPEVPPKPAHLRKPHKPQPPASSPLRREQRAPAPPPRAPKEPKEASLSAGAAPCSPAAPPVIPVALVAPTVPTAAVEPSAPAEGAAPAATIAPTVPAIQTDPAVPTAAVAPTVAPDTPVALTTSAVPTTLVAEPEQPAQGAAESIVSEEASAKPEQGTSVEVKEGEPANERGPVASSEAKAEEGLVGGKTPSRVISEEEARALLAEKRRLAREQAEREAELERQRQEELRRQEEERQRLEEEEQRRFEEEQIRLAAEFRRQEEEKLRRAIEEQEKREAEERQRRELEAQQKAEREEQERKAREEAEKQRKELEERLKREEAERAERKKRVEEIMSRTRRRGGKEPGSPASPASRAGDSQGPDSSEENNGPSGRQQGLQASPERDSSPSLSGRSSPQAPGKQADEAPDAKGSPAVDSESRSAGSELAGPEECAEKSAAPGAKMQQNQVPGDKGEQGVLGKSAAGPPETVVNGREQIGEVACADSLLGERGQDRSGGAVPMDQSPQGKVAPLVSEEVCRTNGYGSHHDGLGMVNGVAPGKVADLLGLDSLTSLVPLKPEGADHSVENLRNAGDINSNRIVPGNQLIEFEEDNKNNKTQEMQFTDLLS